MKKKLRLPLIITAILLGVFLISIMVWWLVPEIDYQNLLPKMDNKVAAVIPVDWDIVMYRNGTFSQISPPSGKVSVFYINGTLSVVSPPGQKVTDIAWSPDGKTIAYIYTEDFSKIETYLATIDIATEKSTTLLEFDSSIAYSGDLNAQSLNLDWSPDGKTIAFDALSPSGAYSLITYDIPTGNHRLITTFPADVRSLNFDWSPGPSLVIGTCPEDFRSCKTWSMDPLSNEHNLKFITDGDGGEWLPGGRRILVSRWDEADYRWIPYTCLEDGQDVRLFPFDSGFDAEFGGLSTISGSYSGPESWSTISDLYAGPGGWSPNGRYFLTGKNFDVRRSTIYILLYDTKYRRTFYFFRIPVGRVIWSPN